MESNIIINDEYEHLDNCIEYILENVLFKETHQDVEYMQLQDDYNSTLISKCHCSGLSCLRDVDCNHGGNYVKDSQSEELVLNPEKLQELIYECTSLCACEQKKCVNRLVQYGPRNNLKIIYSERYQSKGLTTTETIPKGAFICEYAGELLTRQEAQKRMQENDTRQRMNYVLSLCEYISNGGGTTNKVLLTTVDPSRKGNIGRYLNHSCQPNCQIKSVRIDCPLPKIAIFSKNFIKAGEELCFHYNEGIIQKNQPTAQGQKGILCLCGAKNCEKYLPNFKIHFDQYT
ncbi:putative histone-lysine N-methyltransferase set-23 isoform 1-T1 [Glossina fuscipes fuscipes]